MPPTFWQRAALKNPNRRGGDMPAIAKAARQAGFSGFIVQTHQGTDPRNAAGHVVEPEYADMLRAAGHEVAVWGWLTGEDPAGEAKLAADHCRKHRAAAYVANVEVHHKYTQPGPPQFYSPAAFEASVKFIRAFRALQPTMPLGVSTYAHPAAHDIHWQAWLNEGDARILPQAYSNMFGPDYRAVTTYKASIDVKQPWNPMRHPRTGLTIPGFPLSYWHPQLGNWGKGGEIPAWNTAFHDVVTAARVGVGELLEAKQVFNGFYGFHVMDAEHQTKESLAVYGEAIRKGCALQ